MTSYFRSSRVLRCIGLAGSIAVGCALSSEGTARADDLQELLNETVVTTASKSAETETSAPATTTTISSDDLRRYGIHTLAEALNYLSLGVWTQSNGLATDAGARGVILTGDQGSHMLLLLDGHALNEPLFGTARFDRGAGIPMEMIDHIEVVLGPGSVLYGSNAMLGVVNVITKHASDWRGGHVVGEWEAGKSARAGAGVGWTFGQSTELTAMAEYYQQYGPSLTFGPSFDDYDNSRSGPFRFHPQGPDDGTFGGTTHNTPRSQAPSLLLRLKTGDFTVNVGGRIERRSAPFSQPSDFSGHAFSDDPDQTQTDRHLWVDAKHRYTLSPIVQISSRLYADSYDYQRTADTAAGAACIASDASTYYGAAECRLHLVGVSQWAGLEEQLTLDWLKDSRLVTMLGADGRIRTVKSKTDLLDYSAFLNGSDKYLASSYGIVNHTDEILGAYLEQTWRPNQYLGLNGGARLDFDPRFAAQISPRLAASVSPWAGGRFKAIYSTAFSAPTLGESYYASANQVASGSLRPETERSLEASLEQKVLGANKLLFGAFRTTWDQLIELHSLSNEELVAAQAAGLISLNNNNTVVQYRNVSTIQTYGFNAGFNGALNNDAVRYALNVTGTHARVADADAMQHGVAGAPILFSNARVSYDLPGQWPTLGVAGQVMARRPADRAFDGNWPVAPYAPTQLQLRGTVSGDVPHVTGLSYRASFDWVSTKVAPYVVGPYQAYDPRNLQPPYVLAPVDTFRVTLGLQYSFGQ